MSSRSAVACHYGSTLKWTSLYLTYPYMVDIILKDTYYYSKGQIY